MTTQTKEYVKFNGVSYSAEIDQSLINILDKCSKDRNTVKIYLGHKENGQVWPEEHYVQGRIGCSTGDIKITLICHPLSYGGPALLEDNILKVRDIKTGLVLYQHPNFKQPIVKIKETDNIKYPFETWYNGNLHGRHKSLRSAQLCRAKLI